MPVKNSKNYSRKIKHGGVAIIELLVALGISSLMLTAAVLVAFGGQTAGLDVGLTNHGLYRLDNHLGSTLALVMGDWDLATGEALADSTNFYTGQSAVTDISPCLKSVNADIDWTSENNREQNISLNTLVSSVAAAKALGDDCDSFPPSDWDTIGSLGTANVSPAGTEGTGLDVSSINGHEYAFLTTSHDNSATADFWVIDVSNPTGTLVPIASLNITDDGGSAKGLNAVDVAGDYAFAIRNDNTEQLQVIDISDPFDPRVVATSSIPDASSAVARSIFYYEEKLYIGTQYLPCPTCDPEQNNELHIFDVSDPLNPVPEASIDVDRNVNSIMVNGEGIAYLATGPGSISPYTPLKIYDVDPNSPTYLSQIGAFNTTGNQQGRSVYLLGDTLYLGRDRATGSNKDFHIINVSNPSNLQEIGSKKLNLDPSNAAVITLTVQGRLAFLGTSDSNEELQIFDISDPNNIKPPSGCGNTFNFPQAATGVVFSKNLIFASVKSNDALRIIYDTPLVCAL